jgi:hypothetical protein
MVQNLSLRMLIKSHEVMLLSCLTRVRLTGIVLNDRVADELRRLPRRTTGQLPDNCRTTT